MKLKISFFIIITTLALTSCQSKQPKQQKTMTVPATNTDGEQLIGNAPLINHADSTGEPEYNGLEPLPVFPGGEEKMLEFLSKNIRYPAIAEKKGIQGTVIVGFAVTSTGKIEKVHVIRSLYPACDREAIRVVKLMPHWIPGRKNGENEDVNYTLPIKFKME